VVDSCRTGGAHTPNWQTRHQLQLLVDQAGLALPLTHWPLPSAAVSQALAGLPSELAAPELEAARSAVLRDLQQRQQQGRVQLQLRGRAEGLTGFGENYTPGSSVQAVSSEKRLDAGKVTLAGRLGVRLEDTSYALAANPSGMGTEGRYQARLEGSAAVLGWAGWNVQAFSHRHWWGPGWQSSLVNGANTPAWNGVGIQRGTVKPSDSPWLSWMGPWNLDVFVARAQDPQVAARQPVGYLYSGGLEADAAPVLVHLLASVQDDDRMREIMSTWHPDTVYHAAAYKHVPLVEHNPAAGIKNNVLGTLRTARAALEAGVTDFVLVSTDKAVRPTNVMGASKRLAEMALQALAAHFSSTGKGTKFSMVRFGNVLGSSGSVVPRFRQQICDGGPITLTHPEVTRYFMTIPEAAQLVIQAGAMAKGGDVFVLDMGEPVKIIDLARRMIELSGLTVKDEDHPDGDIEIAVTGLRPGEKLYEELLIGDEPRPTVHPRIMKAREEFIPWPEFEARLSALETALNTNDVGVIRLMMQELVAGYAPSDDIVDWVYLEQEGGDAVSVSNNMVTHTARTVG